MQMAEVLAKLAGDGGRGTGPGGGRNRHGDGDEEEEEDEDEEEDEQPGSAKRKRSAHPATPTGDGRHLRSKATTDVPASQGQKRAGKTHCLEHYELDNPREPTRAAPAADARDGGRHFQ
jgi:hypothetical protein